MHSQILNLQATDTWLGIIALILVLLGYLLVFLEESIDLKKSKPVLLTAGIIWILVAIIANQNHDYEFAITAFRKNFLEYAELLLFLIVAMTYINVLEERQIFNVLRIKLINAKFTLKQLFWVTGILAFFISPIADNLTTALLMSSIVVALSPNNKHFICCCCINIVVAANSGGVFSPFGDLTSLMVWQNGKLNFFDFFRLFIPALISFIIPGICMVITIDDQLPALINEKVQLKFGAKRILCLFICTITLAVVSNNILHLPPIAGMMTGLGLLKIFSFYIKKHELSESSYNHKQFDIFEHIKKVEWDTLLFFYGIIMCIGGLDAIGYLQKLSTLIYQNLGINLPSIYQHTAANFIIGILSAIVDNIPLMFAILTMNPIMVKGQWLLVTLTLGIGGSLLSIGSAAGVALMGQTKGTYSFLKHLKWSWAILLGYIVAIYAHLIINKSCF